MADYEEQELEFSRVGNLINWLYVYYLFPICFGMAYQAEQPKLFNIESEYDDDYNSGQVKIEPKLYLVKLDIGLFVDRQGEVQFALIQEQAKLQILIQIT